MRKSHVIVNSLAVVLFAIMTLWSSQVLALTFPSFSKDKDMVVCYTGMETSPTLVDAYTFNVKKHSPLDLYQKKFGHHSTQTTYTAVGKNVVAEVGMNIVSENLHLASVGMLNGMVLTVKKKGARTAFTRTQVIDSNFIQHWECKSDETSATPATWECRYEQADGLNSEMLTRVDLKKASEAVREACGAFSNEIEF